MKLALALTTLGLISVFAVGCSVRADDDAESGPVAARPLTGTIDGKAFAATSAVARKGSDDGERSISIYDTAVTCKDFAPEAERKILISVPWKAGTNRDFKVDFASNDSQTATFVIEAPGSSKNLIATKGRVEVLEAPAEAGGVGKIRLRATYEGSDVEGEIAVEVCE